MNKITAEKGKVFRRIVDGLIFGNEIYLGIDYSTGEVREDLPEYYEEVEAEMTLEAEQQAITNEINTLTNG